MSLALRTQPIAEDSSAHSPQNSSNATVLSSSFALRTAA